MGEYMRRRVGGAVLLLVLALAGCGGGGSAGDPIQGASPGGIWRGSETAGGLAITGLVTESGLADFIRADDAQFVGQLSTTNELLSGAGEAFAQAGNTFPDGSTHGEWQISGTLQERNSIASQLTLTTDNGTTTQATLDLVFDPLYDQPSSLAAVSGSYVPPGGGFALSIDATGGLQLSDLICQTSGHIVIIDPTYNVYQVTMTSTCDHGGTSTASGLATLDASLSPQQLLIGVTGAASSGVTAWQRQ
jgi:hypothetical protein